MKSVGAKCQKFILSLISLNNSGDVKKCIIFTSLFLWSSLLGPPHLIHLSQSSDISLSHFHIYLQIVGLPNRICERGLISVSMTGAWVVLEGNAEVWKFFGLVLCFFFVILKNICFVFLLFLLDFKWSEYCEGKSHLVTPLLKSIIINSYLQDGVHILLK